MKQSWEIKRLGDICETSSGGTPSKSHSEYYENGNIPWLRSGEISQGYIYETELYITEEGLKKSSAKIFPTDTVVIAMYGATVGQVGILKREMSTNQAVCGIFPTPMLYPLFLVYYLKAKKAYFLSLAAGGAQPNISQNIIKNTPIPIPPLSEQEKIVAELDCLSGIIEKKKQLLKEYDALAQSIFYEMFGNPNLNEKKWMTKKISNICENLDYKRIPITAKNRTSGSIPYYGASGIVDYVEDYIFDGTYLLVSEDGANLLMRNTPIAFTIFGKTWVNNHAHVLSFTNYPIHIFVEYFLNLLDLSYIVRGCAQPKLTQASLNEIKVFDVPLVLQQEFASKIEAIEKQKELIKQSIVETETLFNSRMDYYFN